jgi:hypothetical protein
VTQVVATQSSEEEPSPVRRAAPVEGPLIELNAFQNLMCRWSKLHAYNAGQVMRISGTPDRERWKQAIEGVIRELGLGIPRFINDDQAVRFTPVEDIPVEQSKQDLQSYFDEELNRRFAAGDLPIRFCLLPGPEETASRDNGHRFAHSSHYLAAVYDHWIADSRAMRELMHRIFDRYRNPEGGAGGGGRLPALTLEAPNFTGLFRQHVGRMTRLLAIRESLKNIWRHRHGFRLNLRDPLELGSRFVYREMPEGLVGRLHRFAKSRGASVNDLFIAIIGQSMGVYTAEGRFSRVKKPLHFYRRQLGIGTIVDIREAANQPLDRVFNLYLSSYSVLLKNPENRTADDLTREVAKRTERLKKTHASVKGFWALVMARFWFDVYDMPRFRASLLHKTVPMAAGISNVNMSGSWADPEGHADGDGEPRVLDYLRISPAGPLIPLVFTLTTISGRLSLCVTYRTTAFSEEKLLQLVEDFMHRLEAVGA